MNEKTPRTDIRVKLTGQDGNIFNLMGIALMALRTNGRADLCDQLIQAVTSSKSYHEALARIMEFVVVE